MLRGRLCRFQKYVRCGGDPRGEHAAAYLLTLGGSGGGGGGGGGSCHTIIVPQRRCRCSAVLGARSRNKCSRHKKFVELLCHRWAYAANPGGSGGSGELDGDVDAGSW
jgi:hypothetical protein